jgi:hypothetical protein
LTSFASVCGRIGKRARPDGRLCGRLAVQQCKRSAGALYCVLVIMEQYSSL